jgi:Tfp pilus assembly protein PilF
LALLVLALMVRTHVRNLDYLQPPRLWSKVLEVSPHNFRAHNILAAHYRDQGDPQAAEHHFQQALQKGPNYPPAHLVYGWFLSAQGKYAAAERHFSRAIELDPYLAHALDGWGEVYARQGEFDKALEKYRQALAIDPNLPWAHCHIGLIDFERGNFVAAKASFESALQFPAPPLPARLKLIEILSAAANPALRDGKRAILLAKQLVASSNRPNAALLDVLAMAYAENGQFALAEETAKRARHLALGTNDRELAEAIREREQLYRQRSPYRLAK